MIQPRSSPKTRMAIHCIRLVLGGTLVWSGVSKLENPVLFLQSVYRYELVGPALGWYVASALPYAELICGVSLVIGWLSTAVSAGAALLGALFLFAQGMAVARGLSINCGCFTGSDAPIGPESLGRALLVMSAGVYLFIAIRRLDAGKTTLPKDVSIGSNRVQRVGLG